MVRDALPGRAGDAIIGGGTPSFRRAHLPTLGCFAIWAGKVWVGCDVGTGSRRGECVTQDPTTQASQQPIASHKKGRKEGGGSEGANQHPEELPLSL